MNKDGRSLRGGSLHEEQILYEVFEVVKPSPEPFGVLAIYPDRRIDDGCEATVVSLHMTKADAAVDKALRQTTLATVQ